MRFSDLEVTTQPETPVTIPEKLTKDGRQVVAALRVLDAGDEAKVLAGARAFALAKNPLALDPRVGNDLFDLGVMVHTIVLSTVDTDSPKEAREPFFAKVEEVMTLNRDSIVFLYELHETWQNENSPMVQKLSPEELFARTVMIAGADDDAPFIELAPAIRARWARITAKLLVKSPEVRSLFGLPALEGTRSEGELDS